MDKKLLFNIAYWIMLIAVVSLCIFIIFYLKSTGKQCLADPLEYYAKQTGTQCFCMDNFLTP